jgi:hypothetical protein
MTTAETTTRALDPVAATRRFVAAPVDPQTYRNLVYLALAFPLGLVYFVGLVTGGALGLGLLITVVGLPILLLTVVGATLAAGLEAHLTTHLAGVPTPVPTALREFDAREGLALPGNGFLDATRRLVTAQSTWTGVVVVLTKFVFGLVSFVALVTAGAVGTALLAAPVAYDNPSATVTVGGEATVGQYSVGPWLVDTLPEALAVAAGGLVFLLVALNLLNLLARLQAEYTSALLGADADTDSAR